MTCDQTEPLLDALADSELSLWQTWRVRNHVAGCSACAAHLADIQHLDASVHIWRDRSAPAALGVQIAAALPSDAPRIAPRSFPLRRASVGFAILAVALAVFLWFLPGQPGQPTIAFADVEKAMASVNLIDWTHETIDYDKNGAVSDRRVDHIWMRRHPAAIATVTLNGISQPVGMKILEDKRGTVTFRPDGKTIIIPHQITVYGTVAGYNSILMRPLRTLEQENGSKLEHTTLNGQSTFKALLTWHITKKTDLETTLWIDPVTNRLLQMQEREISDGKLQHTYTDMQMSYDKSPPPGMFDRPLNGAKVKRF